MWLVALYECYMPLPSLCILAELFVLSEPAAAAIPVMCIIIEHSRLSFSNLYTRWAARDGFICFFCILCAIKVHAAFPVLCCNVAIDVNNSSLVVGSIVL